MFRCSLCGLLVGPDDQDYVDEPSRPCASCCTADGDYDYYYGDQLELDEPESFAGESDAER